MIQILNDVSTEGLVGRIAYPFGQITAGGIGVIEQQYTAGAAIANTTTETSLMTPSLFAPQINGNPAINPLNSTLSGFPANFLALGTSFNKKIVGTIANTGTPTLRTRVVLKNTTTGAIVYTLADTTATAMTTVSTVDFEVNFDLMTRAVGSTGQLYGRVSHRYATTTVYAAVTTTTVDMTQPYYFDVLVTWGAASASNTLTPFWCVLRIE